MKREITGKVLNVTSELECPHCGERMERIPRRWWHRIISRIAPVVRVRCCQENHLIWKSDYQQQKINDRGHVTYMMNKDQERE